jgi:hypothetical protein
MTATVAATMEAAAHATAVKPSSSHMRASAREPTPNRSVVTGIGHWMSTIIVARVSVAGVSVDRSSIVAAVVPVVSVIAIVVPGAGADKHTTGKPCRSVVSIRCASVGIVPVVSIGADRRITISSINRCANSNSN